MSSQVAIKDLAFFEQINQLVVSDNHDPLTLSQFKNEAQKRAQSDDFDGYLALGTLACLEGNIEAVHANCKQAIAASSAKHAYALGIYAKCLTPFGYFSQAADLMHQAYDLLPSTLNYLDDAIHFYGLAGHFHQVGELLKTWKKINPDKAHQFSQLAREVIEFMDEQNVSDADLERLINLAMSILRQHHLSFEPDRVEIDLFSDEDSLWFHYGIPLHESVEKVVNFNFELADRSVEECPPQIIRGGFVPVFEVVGDE